jgi:hypothetical protein
VRAFEAQVAAFLEVTADCANLASQLHTACAAAAAKARAQARAKIEKLADTFAAAVEAAVAATAVEDWIAGEPYEPRARVQIVHVIPEPSRRYDLGHHLTHADFPVRDLIRNAATTVLED